MGKQNKDTARALADHLKASVREHLGQDSPLSPHDLYRQFVDSSLDYKGALSSGYSADGLAVTIGAEYDYGDLVLPGFVTAKVSAEVQATKTRNALLVIQRQPKFLEKSYAFTNAHPIAFLRFAGGHKKMDLTVDAEIGVGLPDSVSEAIKVSKDIGGEEFSVGLEMEAIASAGVLVGGEFLLVRAENPLWYASAQDQQLVEEFAEELGPGSKDKIKKDAANFLKRTTGEEVRNESEALIQALKAVYEPSSDPIEKAIALWHWEQIYRVMLGDKSKTKKQVYLYLEGLAASQRPQKQLNWQPSRFSGKLKTENLLEQLDTASRWPDVDKARLESFRKALVQNADPPKLKRYREALTHSAGPPGDSGGGLSANQRLSTQGSAATTAPPFAGLSFLRLWGYSGGVEAGVEAKASVGGKAAANEISLSGRVAAGATGRAASTRYRFQTCAQNQSAPQPLLMTQDTIINYIRAEAEAVAQAAAKYSSAMAGRAVSRELKAAYNAMFWRSAVVYWLKPARPSQTVTCEAGSGLCYGMSVSLKRLRALAASPNKESASLFKIVTWWLRVYDAVLRQFLENAWFLNPREQFQFPLETILLESAWAAPAGQTVALAQSTPLPDLSKTFRADLETTAGLNNFQSGASPHATPFVLQSITARYRMADQLDESRELFRLGYTFVVGARLGLSKVTQAGTNSVIDIDTWWVDPTLRARAETFGPAAPYETAVPRVALFHQ